MTKVSLFVNRSFASLRPGKKKIGKQKQQSIKWLTTQEARQAIARTTNLLGKVSGNDRIQPLIDRAIARAHLGSFPKAFEAIDELSRLTNNSLAAAITHFRVCCLQLDKSRLTLASKDPAKHRKVLKDFGAWQESFAAIKSHPDYNSLNSADKQFIESSEANLQGISNAIQQVVAKSGYLTA